jgi:hypothetical protein
MWEVSSNGLQTRKVVWNNCEAILEGDAKLPSKLVLKYQRFGQNGYYGTFHSTHRLYAPTMFN